MSFLGLPFQIAFYTVLAGFLLQFFFFFSKSCLLFELFSRKLCIWCIRGTNTFTVFLIHVNAC